MLNDVNNYRTEAVSRQLTAISSKQSANTPVSREA